MEWMDIEGASQRSLERLAQISHPLAALGSYVYMAVAVSKQVTKFQAFVSGDEKRGLANLRQPQPHILEHVLAKEPPPSLFRARDTE